MKLSIISSLFFVVYHASQVGARNNLRSGRDLQITDAVVVSFRVVPNPDAGSTITSIGILNSNGTEILEANVPAGTQTGLSPCANGKVIHWNKQDNTYHCYDSTGQFIDEWLAANNRAPGTGTNKKPEKSKGGH